MGNTNSRVQYGTVVLFYFSVTVASLSKKKHSGRESRIGVLSLSLDRLSLFVRRLLLVFAVFRIVMSSLFLDRTGIVEYCTIIAFLSCRGSAIESQGTLKRDIYGSG